MHMIFNVTKTLVQLTIVVFLLEVCGRTLLKRTVTGRLVLTTLKDIRKAFMFGFKLVKKFCFMVLAEVKVINAELAVSKDVVDVVEDVEDIENEEEYEEVKETNEVKNKYRTIDFLKYLSK